MKVPLALSVSAKSSFTIGAIYALAISPDGKYLLSSSSDKTVKLLGLLENKELHHFRDIHAGPFSLLMLVLT